MGGMASKTRITGPRGRLRVWGPQQNAIVNGQIESPQAIDLRSDDRKRIRSFANDVLAAERVDAENGER